ncbi:MAG: ATP synthase F1 subunit gamma [Erysipelotrichia bacterium]|nr:ATP synthase F1 subunit gamma [Erysipelotrichia bacterium]
MAQAVTRIKKRIKVVQGSYKITSTMKLVSTVKLKRWKDKMLAFKDYSQQIDELSSLVFSCATPKDNHFFTNNSATKKLFIIIASSLGLCGSYNNNIFRLVDETEIKPEDDVILLGKKVQNRYQNNEWQKIDTFKDYSTVKDEELIADISDFVYTAYQQKHYSEVHLIYTTYINTLLFRATDYLVLPLKKVVDKEIVYPPIMEPDPQTLGEALIPLYLKNTIYAKFLESEVCEHAARSNAMDNATKNAEELFEELSIQFNKARQSAITQEITEIVGAANT